MDPTVASANLLTDNPELYEHQFPDPDRVAARFCDETLRHYGGGGPILDVGCGTGRDAGHLARLGHDVVGLDTSGRMLEHARAHHPDVAFVEADMRSFGLYGRFGTITCLDSTLLYCHENAELDEFLRRCRAHLLPGGLLLAEARNGAFFLGNTELLDGTRTRHITWRGTRYTSRTELWVDHAAQLLRRHREWTWEGAAEPLRQRSAWRLLFPRELAFFLEQAGFEILALADGPGPRTEPPWTPGTRLGSAMSGDRLHLVARDRAR